LCERLTLSAIGMNGGKPFQSKLEPHFDFILEARRKRQTWETIARLLAEQGTTTTKQAIHAFMKRRLKRRYALGMAPVSEPVRQPMSKSTISELPELTESPPSASEFAADPLTTSIKGRKRSPWTVLNPNPKENDTP
jgi:hypothetical protein